jgi:hypothetical protein
MKVSIAELGDGNGLAPGEAVLGRDDERQASA